MDAVQAWQAARGQLQTDMPKAAFDTWVKDVEFVGFEDGSFVLGVNNAYARDWLQSRLSSTVSKQLTGLLNRTVEVQFVVWQNTLCAVREKVQHEIYETEEIQKPNRSINTRYTFQNFVVGPSNRLAHAASMAVAERPAQAYNPLFLYGGVGLGKNSSSSRNW